MRSFSASLCLLAVRAVGVGWRGWCAGGTNCVAGVVDSFDDCDNDEKGKYAEDGYADFLAA